MKTTTKRPGGWSAIRPPLTTWEKPALITLIKELYDAAAVNRDLLHARLLAGANDDKLLEKYRRKIAEQFFPARGFGKLKLGEARKAIRDYRKATGNIAGTAELLMSYVENGTCFTREYGDIDERFYNSIESALAELATLLRGMRLTVRRVIEQLAIYPKWDDLITEYPELEPEDIRQALEFAANNLDDKIIPLETA